MKRSEFLKSSALMGTGLVAMPANLSCADVNDQSKVTTTAKSQDPNPIVSRKYIGTLDLSNDMADANQLLIASQNYGTFHCIYWRFEHDPDPKNRTENHVTINKMHLELINYKGIVNIGFDGIPIVYDTTQKLLDEYKNLEFEGNKESKALLIFTSALRGSNSRNVTVSCDQKINKGDTLNVFRLIRPISDYRLKEPGWDDSHQNDPIFDSEFLYRDGLWVEKRGFKPGQLIGPPTDAPSIRCHQSVMRMTF